RRRHTRCYRDWSSDVCSSDLFSSASTTACGFSRALLRRDRGARRARLRPLHAAREAAGGGGRAAEGAPLAMRIEVICTGDEVLRSEERRVGKERRERLLADGC